MKENMSEELAIKLRQYADMLDKGQLKDPSGDDIQLLLASTENARFNMWTKGHSFLLAALASLANHAVLNATKVTEREAIETEKPQC